MLISILAFATAGSMAQAPVPDTDTTSTPIREGDPTLETLPRGLDYVEDKKRITPEELPDAVKQTLESGTRYGKWKEEATIFHDRNQDEYIVEVDIAGKTSTYRFDKEGKPIVQKE